MAAKSPMFFRNTVDRTTFSSPLPAAFKIAERFLSTRSVWTATSPPSTCWVDGSMATCPETKTNSSVRIACEYGPIACGASLVEITSRIHPPQISRRMQMISNAVRNGFDQRPTTNGQRLDFLQPLYVVYSRNFAHAVDDIFQVLEVGNVQNDIDVRLRIRTAHLHIADVGLSVADHRRDLFQHAEPIVARDRKLHRIRTR